MTSERIKVPGGTNGVHEAEGGLGTGTALFGSLKAELFTWWDQGTESRGHILRVIKGKVRESTMGENFQQKLVIGWKKKMNIL